MLFDDFLRKTWLCRPGTKDLEHFLLSFNPKIVSGPIQIARERPLRFTSPKGHVELASNVSVLFDNESKRTRGIYENNTTHLERR